MVSIGPTIRVSGESEYRQALRRIYSETKTLDKQMEGLKNSFNKYDSELSKNKKTSEMLTKKIEKQKTVVDATKTTYERANQKFNDTVSLYENQREKTEQLDKTYTEHSKTVDGLRDLYGKESIAVKEAEEAQAKMKKELEDSQKQQDKYYQEVFRSAEVMEEWNGKVSQAEAELENYKTELINVGNTLQSVGQDMQNFGEKMANVGDWMSTHITAPLTAIGVASVKQASDFEDGMRKIYTIAQEGEKPMAEMREELIALSRETGFSLEDLAEAAYQSVSASVDAANATEFLATATQLARAGFTSTTNSVDLLTTVMNAYGKGTYDAAYISDVLLRTQNDGKTIIDELAGSMGTVIPTAANYNISLEQLAAAYATMTKQGVNTARATTFMNAMFTELEKEGSGVAIILEEETGKSFAQLMGEGYNLSDVLGILYHNVGDDIEQFQRLFGNVRSGKAAAALTADNFGILNYEMERMADTTGQTAYAIEMLQSPSLEAKKVLNEFKLTAVDIGTVLIQDWMPTFQEVANKIHDVAIAFHNLDPNVKSFLTKAGLVVAAVGPILSAGGRFIKNAGKVIGFIGEITKEVSLGEGVIGKLAIGIGKIAPFVGIGAAVGAGMYLLADATYKSMEADWEKIKSQEGLTSEMEKTKKAVDDLDSYYKGQLRAQQENLESTMMQVEVIKSLTAEYNNLVDETGLATEESQRMADVLIEELCEALGMSEEEVRSLIDENGKFTKSMDEVISKIEEEAKMAAVKELLKTTIIKQVEAQRNLEQASKDVAYQQGRVKTTEENLKKAQDELNRAQQRGGEDLTLYKKKVDDARLANKYANDTLKDLQTTERQAAREVQSLAQDHDYYMGVIAQSTGQAADGMASEFAEGTSSMKVSMDEAYQYIMGRIATISSEWAKQSFSATVNVGYSIGAGIESGIKQVTKTVTKASQTLGKNSTKFVARGAMVQSPSRATMETGKYIGEGLIVGMDSMLKAVNHSAQAMANVALGEQYYLPAPTSERSISAPISVAVNVNGNVDDPHGLADEVSELIIAKLRGESEVFA